MRRNIERILLERFGDPIGSYAGEAPAGVRDELSEDGCTHVEEDNELDEVTPPGKEKMVKSLKRKKGIKNPWAVAWSAHKRQK